MFGWIAVKWVNVFYCQYVDCGFKSSRSVIFLLLKLSMKLRYFTLVSWIWKFQELRAFDQGHSRKFWPIHIFLLWRNRDFHTVDKGCFWQILYCDSWTSHQGRKKLWSHESEFPSGIEDIRYGWGGSWSYSDSSSDRKFKYLHYKHYGCRMAISTAHNDLC